jgi:hypothetical protein
MDDVGLAALLRDQTSPLVSVVADADAGTEIAERIIMCRR